MSVEAKVGAFVILCLLLLGVTVYYVSSDQWNGHLTPYRTYLRYAGGVAPGTDVLFGGIEAGKVTSVSAWSQDPTRIEIRFQVKEGTPVNRDSIAKIESVSLMSSPALSITTGSNNAPRLKAGEAIRSEESVSMDDMTRKLSTIADNANGLIAQVRGELKDVSGDVRTLLANLNDVTGTPNRREIAQLLQHVNLLVATESPKIDAITQQLLLASRDADSAIQKAGPLIDDADKTVGNVNLTIDQLRDPIRQDLAQLQTTLEQTKAMMASIQVLVRSNDANIGETVDNLRVVTENLDQLTDQVKQQPWSLIRIRQPKDRKVPR
ncbi:MAG TPA: MlaD family protein [Bryobacteraceae bacterium]|nr:MlaD family protein [Bryobacteraceae bacterium]